MYVLVEEIGPIGRERIGIDTLVLILILHYIYVQLTKADILSFINDDFGPNFLLSIIILLSTPSVNTLPHISM